MICSPRLKWLQDSSGEEGAEFVRTVKLTGGASTKVDTQVHRKAMFVGVLTVQVGSEVQLACKWVSWDADLSPRSLLVFLKRPYGQSPPKAYLQIWGSLYVIPFPVRSSGARFLSFPMSSSRAALMASTIVNCFGGLAKSDRPG